MRNVTSVRNCFNIPKQYNTRYLTSSQGNKTTLLFSRSHNILSFTGEQHNRRLSPTTRQYHTPSSHSLYRNASITSLLHQQMYIFHQSSTSMYRSTQQLLQHRQYVDYGNNKDDNDTKDHRDNKNINKNDTQQNKKYDDLSHIQMMKAGTVSNILKRNPLLGKEDELRDMYKEFKRLGNEFWEATKQLYRDFRESMQLRRKLKAEGKEALTRREHRLLHHNKIDQAKLIPFVVLQFLPMSMVWILILCLRWPNVLPSTFTSIDVIQNRIETISGRERENDSRVIRRAVCLLLLQTIKDCQDKDSDIYRAAVRTESVLRKVATHKPVSEVEEHQLLMDLVLLNKEEIVTLNSLAYSQLYALTEFTRMMPFYPYRGLLLASLRRKCNYISFDDDMIRKEGIKSLSTREVEESLFERGISPRDTEEENRYLLTRWINQSQTFTESEMFCFILSKCLVYHNNERLPTQIE